MLIRHDVMYFKLKDGVTDAARKGIMMHIIDQLSFNKRPSSFNSLLDYKISNRQSRYITQRMIKQENQAPNILFTVTIKLEYVEQLRKNCL